MVENLENSEKHYENKNKPFTLFESENTTTNTLVKVLQMLENVSNIE